MSAETPLPAIKPAHRIAGAVLRFGLLAFTAWVIIRVLRDIDFAQVWDALKTLTWTEFAVLVMLLLAMRTFSAVPLTRFIPQLSLPRSLLNDLSANLVGAVAPPPSDMVVRYSMFQVWRIDITAGFAGVTLNSLMYYFVRLAAPVVGVIVLLAVGELHGGMVWTTGVSALLAIVILGVVIAAVRAERLAASIGRTAGRAGHRITPQLVEPEVWANKMVQFRGLVGDQLKNSWFPALVALFAMVVADATVLVFALRSVSIPASEIRAAAMFGVFFAAYPLTMLPFAGIGVFDAVLYEFIADRIGSSHEAAIVAALVIWRTTTLLTPYPVGAVALGLWRRANPKAAAPAEPSPI